MTPFHSTPARVTALIAALMTQPRTIKSLAATTGVPESTTRSWVVFWRDHGLVYISDWVNVASHETIKVCLARKYAWTDGAPFACEDAPRPTPGIKLGSKLQKGTIKRYEAIFKWMADHPTENRRACATAFGIHPYTVTRAYTYKAQRDKTAKKA